MSNFSPDPEDSRDLVPLDNSEILPVFISSQANGLFDATDPKVQKEILENIEKAIELSKRLKDMQAEETIRPIEIERKKSVAQLEIEENRYKILSLKVKKTLGIVSIPISLAFGLYSYVVLDIAISTRMKYNVPFSWKRIYNESLLNRLKTENH
jgi:hypothetical protein